MLVVVGGHSRNIGKTSVVAGLIGALPEARWTAMKITQFGHGVCSVSGASCDCCLAPEHSYAIAQEPQPGPSDTGRFLAAGACVVIDRDGFEPQWPGVSRGFWEGKPQFRVRPPHYVTDALSTFVADWLAAAGAASAGAS